MFGECGEGWVGCLCCTDGRGRGLLVGVVVVGDCYLVVGFVCWVYAVGCHGWFGRTVRVG